ncbi:hypothetical protein [Faecalispora jeddahensis]|uniref:hypothetical protein n=1 Tax=Faecalispora jeddahensis TaxID=1414721 RepID=UPI001896E08D|nr:hypothetical protein [Faecalispora jeddahensis]
MVNTFFNRQITERQTKRSLVQPTPLSAAFLIQTVQSWQNWINFQFMSPILANTTGNSSSFYLDIHSDILVISGVFSQNKNSGGKLGFRAEQGLSSRGNENFARRAAVLLFCERKRQPFQNGKKKGFWSWFDLKALFILIIYEFNILYGTTFLE